IGEFALASAPFGVMLFLSSTQEQAALVRELSTLQPRVPMVSALSYAVFGFSFVLTLVIGVAVAIASYFLFSGPIGHPQLFPPALALLACYVFIQTTCWNADVVLLAFRAGHPLFWIRLEQALVFFGVAVAGALTLGNLWGLVIAWTSSWLVTLVTRA